jgi:nitrous oxidase accessory protein NosD
MNKKILTIGLITLLLFSIKIMVIPVKGEPPYTADIEGGNTIYVDDNNTIGPWDGSTEHPYQHIQDGIDNVTDEDTVYVFNGIYYENVVINKRVKLIGENKNSTIINASNVGNVITVSADETNISGFTIRNSADCWSCAGILVSAADYISITENDFISNHYNAIRLDYSEHSSIFRNNFEKGTFQYNDNKQGIYLFASNGNTISNNVIVSLGDVGRSWAGIGLDEGSNNNIISENMITGPENGIVLAEWSNGNSLISNIVSECEGQGIGFGRGISDTIVTENTIAKNGCGLIFASGYGPGVVPLRNKIFHNNFVGNGGLNGEPYQAIDPYTTNQWDDDYPSGGNYWSDYTGTDGNGDGIGDTSYDIPLGNNEDRYPFMAHFLVLPLEIHAPDTAEENTHFQVTVTTYDVPVKNISVTFFGNTYLTNNTGQISLTAPLVNKNTDYVITASKEGYLSAEVWITIKDTGSYPSEEQLSINAPSTVDEEETFLVIISSNSLPIENAKVDFLDGTYFTNQNGKVYLRAPAVEYDTNYTIRANKSGYLDALVRILVKDSNPSPEDQLVISAPPFIVENQEFLITVTASSTPIANVMANFSDITYMTNANGTAILTSPSVENDTMYLITASKTGYRSATVSIIVVNLESSGSTVQIGWIYGRVTDTSGTPLEDAKVSVILLDSNNVITSICKLTDNDGKYSISVPPGIYTVKVSKDRYLQGIMYGVIVHHNSASELNLILEYKSTGEENYPIDFALDHGIKTGIIIGDINIQHPLGENVSTEVTTYSENASITITTLTTTKLLFIIQASEEIGGKILTVRFGPGTLEDMNNIGIIYDNGSIPWVDFDTIFKPDMRTNDTNATARWTSIVAIDKDGNQILYCLLWVPHFSEHEITISTLEKVVEAIGMTVALVLYMTVFAILGILYLVPFFLVRKNK